MTKWDSPEDDPAFLPGVPVVPNDAPVKTGNPYDPFALAHAKTTAADAAAAAAAAGDSLSAKAGVPSGQLASIGVNTVRITDCGHTIYTDMKSCMVHFISDVIGIVIPLRF